MSRVPTERTVLLPSNAIHNVAGSKEFKPGPMELSTAHRRGILASLWLGTFLGAMNTTLVATLMSAISSEYEAANQAAWLGTAFLLATCTFTPLYGRLCTVMGRRGAQQVALTFASMGTLMCALSPSMNMLIAARFLTGFGGGGLFVTTGIVTSDMYSMRDRSLTQGIAAVVNGMGLGIGGLLGGEIMDRFGWRYAFFLQLPFFAVSFIMTTLLLNYETPGSSKSTKDVLRRIDYGGVLTLLTMVGSFLIFLSVRFNAEYPWSHPYVLCSLLSAGISLVAFVIVELYVSPEPIMPPFLLKQKIPVLVSISNVLVSICNLSVTYFFPMWFETVKLTTASSAGAHVAPNSVAMSLGSLFAGWIMHRTGRYKTLNMIFGTFPTFATILIASLDEDSSEWLQWLSIVPLGFGASVVLQTTLIALLAFVDKPSMAVAMGFVQLFSGLGQVSGVAISSALFQTILSGELRERLHGPDSEKLIKRVKHSSEIVRQLPLDLQRPVRDSYGIALRAVFLLAATCTVLAYLVRIPIPELSMDEDDDHNESAIESDQDDDRISNQTSPRTATPSSEESERHDTSPITIPSRPMLTRRLSTYQNTPMDVDRGRSARRLRNPRPRGSV